MEIIDKKRTNKELKLGIILSYFLIAINISSGFILVPLIIDGIGKSNYGLYSAASSLITMFIVDLGLGTAITKFISKYRVTSNEEQINKLVSVVFYCFLALSIFLLIIFIILFQFLDLLYSSFTVAEIESFKVVFLMVASYSVLTFPFGIVNGILVAYDKIFWSKIADIISKVAFIILTIIVLKMRLGLYFLTACYAVHGLLCIALKILFVKAKTPCHFFNKMTFFEFKKMFKEVASFSIWAAINSFGRVLLVSFAPSILGFVSSAGQGSKEIALFSIAAQMESYVSLFATSFGSIFYPTVSRVLFFHGEPDEMAFLKFQDFHIKIARIQVLILAIIILGFFMCGKEFIYLWVGDGYEKAYYCVLIICTPALFFYPLQTAENAIAAIERIKYCGISTILSTVIGIIASVVFGFLLGSIGVSLGICIGFLTRTILFNLCFKKFLKINSFLFYFKSYFSFIIPMAFIVVAGIFLNYLFPAYSLLSFLLKILTISIVYLFFVCVFGLNENEKSIIDIRFKKIFKRVNAFLGELEK